MSPARAPALSWIRGESDKATEQHLAHSCGKSNRAGHSSYSERSPGAGFLLPAPGKPWQKTEGSTEISGMHHNVFGGYLDLRPAIYACGSGNATIRNFRYWPEVKVPA